ncbi:hypothetical protein R3P38DRAFT_3179854 [Favolaschia claudopus]|uniref:Uncharacterized protein n=1 Tax=Favolaschia claudopus TaxID=2862362 RepID=A0AAW0CQ06_9AGAR
MAFFSCIHSLRQLTIDLEPHWMAIVDHGAPLVVTLAHTLPLFHSTYNLVNLSHMHIIHFPSLLSASPRNQNHLTEILFGPIGELRPSSLRFKEALESATSLERLGFLREVMCLSAPELSTMATTTLPSLTTLAFHHTPPSLLHALVSSLDMARFTTIVISHKRR